MPGSENSTVPRSGTKRIIRFYCLGKKEDSMIIKE
jgi:hypothetical protein